MKCPWFYGLPTARFGGSYTLVPLYRVYINTNGYEGYAEVGVVPELPVEGVALLLGNELAGQMVRMAPAFGIEGLHANLFNAMVGTLR